MSVIGVTAVANLYCAAGISGPQLQHLFENWGVAAEIQAKAKRPETDTVGGLVANGEAESGITAIATLIATPNIDVVDQTPQEIQSYVSCVGCQQQRARARCRQAVDPVCHRIGRASRDRVKGDRALAR